MRDTKTGPPTFWSANDGTLQCYRGLVDTVAEGLFHVDGGSRFLQVDGAVLDPTAYDRDHHRGGNAGGGLGGGIGRHVVDNWIDAERDVGATVYFTLRAIKAHDG